VIETCANPTVTVATGAGVTVIVAVPFFPSLIAVIVAVPLATAVTTPVDAFTVAIAGASELHTTERSVSGSPPASSIVTVACDVPTAVIVLGASWTEIDAIGTAVTVRVALPLFPSLVPVTTAVPTPTAVTMPVTGSTDATARALELHVATRPVSGTFPVPKIAAVA
jgi:hypothetical protein